MSHKPYEVRDNRRPGWLWLNSEILEEYAPFIKARGVAVYVALCLHSDNNTQQCYPSHKKLSEASGVGIRTIQAVLDDLYCYSLIEIERRANAGKPNRYTLLKVLPIASAKSAHPKRYAKLAEGYAKPAEGYAAGADELDSSLDPKQDSPLDSNDAGAPAPHHRWSDQERQALLNDALTTLHKPDKLNVGAFVTGIAQALYGIEPDYGRAGKLMSRLSGKGKATKDAAAAVARALIEAYPYKPADVWMYVEGMLKEQKRAAAHWDWRNYVENEYADYIDY